jgi:hypothetical protein
MGTRDKIVDILGKRYKIKFLRDAKFEDSEFGECDFDKMEISVNTDKGVDHQRDTLVHEILHAIDYDCKLKLSESQIRSLGRDIFQVLRVNKHLRGWLFSERKTLNK